MFAPEPTPGGGNGPRLGAGAAGASRPLIGEPVPFDRNRLMVSAPEAAARLLGALLVRRETDGSDTIARIVETEAYREDDPASHSYVGRTARTEPMFLVPGTAYVYRSYGVHWCLNVTVEPPSTGAAVLLRAAEVLHGVDRVRSRRPTARTELGLLRGPGNLAAGLDVDAPRHDRGDLIDGCGGLWLADDGWRPPRADVVIGPRVGVTQAPDRPWRFHLATAGAVSVYRRSPRASNARPERR